MILTIPIREGAQPFQAKSFRMCRYATLREDASLTPLECADTQLPRICTFYSYLKSNHFNSYKPKKANSFRMHTCVTRGEGGDIPF